MHSLITRSKRLALGGGLAAALLGAAAPACAFQQIQWAGQTVWGAPWDAGTTQLTFNDVLGSWYTIYFGGTTSSGSTIPGLWSSVTLELVAVKDLASGGEAWTFDYSIVNASKSPISSSLVTEFGFTEDQELTTSKGAVNASSKSVMSSVSGSNNFTTTWVASDSRHGTYGYHNGKWGYYTQKQTYDDSDVTLSGGSVAQGKTDTGVFTLDFQDDISSFTLSDPYVDYEYGSQYGGKLNGYYTDCGPSGKTVQAEPMAWVPEPGTWALMLAGVFGVGSLLRARRRRAPPPALA